MAQLIDMATEGRLHVFGCPTQEAPAITAATRHCLCVDGDTATLDEMVVGQEFGTPMQRYEFRCEHMVTVRHSCPACGFTREFGGPR